MSFFDKQNNDIIVSPVSGRMFPIEEVNDEVFSTKLMGNGVAFEIDDDFILAPCDGKVVTLFPTGHAFGIRRKDGLEVLVHIGINTVELEGKGFKIISRQGVKVKCGDPIVQLDLGYLRSLNIDLTTMLIITQELDIHQKFIDYGYVESNTIINRGE